jgi:transposase
LRLRLARTNQVLHDESGYHKNGSAQFHKGEEPIATLKRGRPEAGPTGYVVYWQLAQLGVKCAVVAPTLVLVKAGGRVKTDRRNAEKLVRCYRFGALTAVWVPDEDFEALRDLVRAREQPSRIRCERGMSPAQENWRVGTLYPILYPVSLSLQGK